MVGEKGGILSMVQWLLYFVIYKLKRAFSIIVYDYLGAKGA